MATNVAPPKNTGGGGFAFEDDVCAWLLASMLVGEPVFGVDCGPPVRLDFQTRPDGWFLDDILVTTAVGPLHHRFALSVKSNAQFTATSQCIVSPSEIFQVDELSPRDHHPDLVKALEARCLFGLAC